ANSIFESAVRKCSPRGDSTLSMCGQSLEDTNDHGPYSKKCVGTRRRLGRSDFVVRPRRQSDESATTGRTDELAVLRGHSRHRSTSVAVFPISEVVRSDAVECSNQAILESVSARQLVLPALAPRLRARVRSNCACRGDRARRPKRLDAALLELLQTQ